MQPYRINDWYWTVADTNPTTQVYSSASASFVAITDATYQSWLGFMGNAPTQIPTQADLIWVFNNGGYPAGAAGLNSSD
jgi:hypothetical protein